MWLGLSVLSGVEVLELLYALLKMVWNLGQEPQNELHGTDGPGSAEKDDIDIEL